MALTDITRVEIEKALEEYDRLGREAFLTHYGFRPARRYLLVHHGRHYERSSGPRTGTCPADGPWRRGSSPAARGTRWLS
ncbi:hypothetical protein [Streptomyces bangladeshensis]|uniref:ScoMcrA-like N-terminal head domain-containing protein n=1 Tax=Streptomyces bangladeshensis TaxID=295352 RepID=A0ABP5NTZ7_9ACTN